MACCFGLQDKGTALASFKTSSTVSSGIGPETIILSSDSSNTTAPSLLTERRVSCLSALMPKCLRSVTSIVAKDEGFAEETINGLPMGRS